MLGSFNHGSMANAMPQAIGAQMAYPDRQIIAMCGDGGISMLLGDLATIKQYNLPVKLIIFNNRTLGMVKLEMEVAGLPDNETDMENPDFTLIGKAMGIESESVKNPDNFTIAEMVREKGTNRKQFFKGFLISTHGKFQVHLFYHQTYYQLFYMVN